MKTLNNIFKFLGDLPIFKKIKAQKLKKKKKGQKNRQTNIHFLDREKIDTRPKRNFLREKNYVNWNFLSQIVFGYELKNICEFDKTHKFSDL